MAELPAEKGKPFETPEYRTAFETFRRLPGRVLDQYLGALELPECRNGRFLDVGAGPGLQSEAILDRLPLDWRLTAIEPSPILASAAAERLRVFNERAETLQTSLAEFDSTRNFDGIWLSEVVHLLDSSAWADKVASLARPSARILIRTSTFAQLRSREWYSWFPEALGIDLARHKDHAEIVGELRRSGFVNVVAREIDESRPVSLSFLTELFESRAFSTLHELSANELFLGIDRLRRSRPLETEIMWNYRMTAYTATLPPGSRL